MKLVYGITVADEINEIKSLISILKENTEDDIVVLCDELKVTDEVIDYLKTKNISYYIKPLNNNFGEFKNELNEICITKHNADYIFQLDADEIINKFFIKNIKTILEHNNGIDLFYVPRINIVNGITDDHLNKWGWRMNNKGYINFPDNQGRIYKSTLKWKGKVHERIICKTYSVLPDEERFCIKHIKEIKKQEIQNSFYSKL